ncbi:unnamed protein product (macronuclear) [Paramecium tetraurelia]|uniref:Mitochondrial carrier protein n=1 Tax=Paramecium tetraurelia TaxID=5888 RepID=A0D6F3_PARTE|nr:uncharacterized protein GSPATT00001661001 [Paramecium tetraurelia]CAK78620.1 unnamed protein product [Paramecium tetraurelia]|eukprot:XP_001446017.1 hypothetical protein (macronuclear) [Paramecium tetraurelia strain d4-2]
MKQNDLRFAIASQGATICVQFLHPLDIIKTRMQSHDGQTQKNLVPKYGSISNAIKQIYKEEGLKGFTKGIFWSLCANSIARVLFFVFYESKKEECNSYFGHGSKKGILIASIYASLLAQIMTQPLWVTLTRLQLNVGKMNGFENVRFTVQQIYNQHGVLGFYRGLKMALLTSCHGMIQINCYEWCLSLLTQFEQHKDFNSFIAGGFSKGFAIFCTYPMTTIKTRIIQNQYIGTDNPKYKNNFDIANKILEHEGLRGFYKGISASVLKGMPSKAIYFFFYEHFKDMLNVGRTKNIN